MSYFRKFSLVTICHGRWAHLAMSWSSWAEQDYPNVEHVVVASGYDESPVQLAEDDRFNGPIVRVRNAPYFRPSYLRNLGARISTGEYIGFVDCDVSLHPQWISACVQSLRERFDIVCNHVMFDGEDSGGSSGTLAMQRWLFEKVRGYNENLDENWGWEDTDLVVRAQRAGGRISSYPLSMAQHRHHNDEIRAISFRGSLKVRSPKVFLTQIKICEDDKEIHPFEANRVVRLSFPPDVVTKIHTGS